MPRETVYIANVLKCRPPGNRDPSPRRSPPACRTCSARSSCCGQRLMLAVGRIAAQNLLGDRHADRRLRGTVHRFGPRATPLIVTYHPAYLLRSPGEKRKCRGSDLKIRAPRQRRELARGCGRPAARRPQARWRNSLKRRTAISAHGGRSARRRRAARAHDPSDAEADLRRSCASSAPRMPFPWTEGIFRRLPAGRLHLPRRSNSVGAAWSATAIMSVGRARGAPAERLRAPKPIAAAASAGGCCCTCCELAAGAGRRGRVS